MSRRPILVIAAAIAAMVSMSFVAAANAAEPPEPTYGKAVVDGDEGEWAIPGDFFGGMHPGYKSDLQHPETAKAYLRYDCKTQVMYVLVLGNEGLPVLVRPDDAWARIDGGGEPEYKGSSGDDGSAPDFSWIDPRFDGDPDHARGYEGSFELAPGAVDFMIMVHVESSYEGDSTAGFVDKSEGGLDLHLNLDNCPADPPAGVDPSITNKNAEVSDPATASYTRAFSWSIDKSVDQTLVRQVGGSGTFNYTVNAGVSGSTDSGWTLDGGIKISNPNQADLQGVTITDTVDNGGTCTVADGSNITIPAGATVDLTYHCTYDSAPSPASGINKVTATWNAAASQTPNGTASSHEAFSFGDPTSVVNGSVTVTDTFAGTLGTPSALDGSATYNYTRTLAIPAYGCETYGNTASITETSQSSSKSVSVCGPIRTGALTIGFWQNKNGQAIINGDASTSGVCNLTPWLRALAPFEGLSSTASCSKAASYITGVIKAANASGAAMNAMLKAQMLATTLDVYFSSPSLGGNKIGAATPIGGVSVDLTAICRPGQPCSAATWASSASVFGGALSLTVSEMLSAAAAQSSSGGATWYGNDKPVQELAKNAFDAINNQIVFAP